MSFVGLLVASLLIMSTASPAGPNPRVRIETKLGAIVVEIDSKHAPMTAHNFLRYVDAGRYNSGRFHRTVTLKNQPDKKIKIEVIQAGVNPKFEKEDFAPIPLERTTVTRLHHRAGTISMARDGPDTATSDFFICVTNEPELDFGGKRNPDGQGFAAFGRVLKGMTVVRKIQRSPASEQKLEPPIEIISISRIQSHR